MPCSQDDSLTDLTQWFDDHLSVYGQSSFPIPSEDLELEIAQNTPPDDEMSSLTNLQYVLCILIGVESNRQCLYTALFA